MKSFTAAEVHASLTFDRLVPALRSAFATQFGRSSLSLPDRLHYEVPAETAADEGTASSSSSAKPSTSVLLMPAFEHGGYGGVKTVTVAGHNAAPLPGVQGSYLLLNMKNGSPVAVMEGTALTLRRTAAASAVASSLIVSNGEEEKKEAPCTTMLMVGTGALAPHLIEAHCRVLPHITVALVWGRSASKAKDVCDALIAKQQSSEGKFLPSLKTIEVVENLEEGVRRSRLISAATMSTEPLVQGEWVQPGTHIDLVGSYRPDMREVDDTCIKNCNLFVDTRFGALNETGDVVQPIRNGVIAKDDIVGDLAELCADDSRSALLARCQNSGKKYTLFKSTGHSLEDLVAAKLVAGLI